MSIEKKKKNKPPQKTTKEQISPYHSIIVRLVKQKTKKQSKNLNRETNPNNGACCRMQRLAAYVRFGSFSWLTDFSSHGKPHFRATRRQVVVVSIWCEISKSEKLHAATGHKPEAHGEAAVPCPCPSLYFFTAPVLKFACWFTRPSYKYITRPDFFYFLKNK